HRSQQIANGDIVDRLKMLTLDDERNGSATIGGRCGESDAFKVRLVQTAQIIFRVAICVTINFVMTTWAQEHQISGIVCVRLSIMIRAS
ncbi:hypothetical protein O6449_24235, partial [Salmonella enterica subsp. enterica]